MIRPVTSTSVATNGADEVAGSAPSFLSKSGSIEPANEPHKTTPTSEKPTVNANQHPVRAVNILNIAPDGYVKSQ
jgi:hypothetical protein